MGTLKDVEQCVLMGKTPPDDNKCPKKSSYGFYMSLVAQHVEQIWTVLKRDVSDTFRVKKLAGQFVSYDHGKRLAERSDNRED